MLLADERAAIVAACLRLTGSGLLRGTSGNISVRDLGSGTVAVTPSGVAYGSLTPAEVVVLDATGARLDGEMAPTSETALHLAVYRARPDVGAIVHTHSMFATVFAVLGEPIPPVHYLLARAGGAVPVAPYARYGTPELADNCVATLAGHRAVLLANHGVIATGTDLDAAVTSAEDLEYVAELAYRARQIGTPQLLDDAQLTAAAEAFDSYGQPA